MMKNYTSIIFNVCRIGIFFYFSRICIIFILNISLKLYLSRSFCQESIVSVIDMLLCSFDNFIPHSIKYMSVAKYTNVGADGSQIGSLLCDDKNNIHTHCGKNKPSNIENIYRRETFLKRNQIYRLICKNSAFNS